ncbi:hypothetical protein PPL_02073 [Heterostelium album PN500]|uniref:Uncharacterized protein n=1 Tax=Heterostelium pallidum (strain ATCC 26659 / Pp 5 / PN500) TaxID=670386 RepID=D3B1A2_HETP5|nr:hypothetical protein PPL_02073 [Heterostelium album PN500]EFA85076.1 hypothetical protein PPL_02073 [Heterostelium album PN500]|eukprot:XP_020437186.1 hypothetical protein PPL_02073 [Heterostelium album PN500]
MYDLNNKLNELHQIVIGWNRSSPLLNSNTLVQLESISLLLNDIYNAIKPLNIQLSDIMNSYKCLGVFLTNLSTLPFTSIGSLSIESKNDKQHLISKQTLDILLVLLYKTFEQSTDNNKDEVISVCNNVRVWIVMLLQFRIYQNQKKLWVKTENQPNGDRDPQVESMYQFMNDLEEFNQQLKHQHNQLSNYTNTSHSDINDLIRKINLIEISNSNNNNNDEDQHITIQLSLLNLFLSQRQTINTLQVDGLSIINLYLSKEKPIFNIAIWRRHPTFLLKELLKVFKKYYKDINEVNVLTNNGVIQCLIEYPSLYTLSMEFLVQLWIETQSFQALDFLSRVNSIFINQRSLKDNYISLHKYYPISLRELIKIYQAKFNSHQEFSSLINRINDTRVSIINHTPEDLKSDIFKSIWLLNELDLNLLNYIVWCRYTCSDTGREGGYHLYFHQFKLLIGVLQSKESTGKL